MLHTLLESLREDAGLMTEASDRVARTILQQLGGSGRLKAMVGAKNMVYDKNWLSFKFSNPDRKRPNYIKIELADDDTYTVTFGRMVKYDLKNEKIHDGIYAGQLKPLIERATGLRLSL